MAIDALDHVNIRSSHMAESVAFYTDILGMTATPGPGYRDLTEVAWIRAPDGRPVVHLNVADDAPDFLGESRDWNGVTGTGRVHHMAFECSEYGVVCDRLIKAGVTMRFNDIPQIALRQIFTHDPNGVLIELNFR